MRLLSNLNFLQIAILKWDEFSSGDLLLLPLIIHEITSSGCLTSGPVKEVELISSQDPITAQSEFWLCFKDCSRRKLEYYYTEGEEFNLDNLK